MKFLEECKQLIRIKSVTTDGNEEIANYLFEKMKQIGLDTKLQPVSHSLEGVSKKQFNVIGILGDPLVDRKTKKGLLLNTHLDTVAPGVLKNWTETHGDPFSPIVKDGKIFGLGSADVKLDFLCKLHAIEKFREKKLKMPIYLVGTCGEEMGMFGAKYLIQSGVLNPKYVVVGEPSELKVVYSHKSLNIFKVSIGYQIHAKDTKGFNRKVSIKSLGKSAHGSYPHLGVNAIHRLLDLLRSSIEQGYDMKFLSLSGGETTNKVPDESQAVFYLTSHQFEDYKRFFKTHVTTTGEEPYFEVEFSNIEDTGLKFIPDSAFDALTQISDHFKKLTYQFSKVTDSTYDPAHSTINFGLMKNTPQGFELSFDLRILPDQDATAIKDQILKDIQGIAVHFPQLNIQASLARSNPGLNMTLEHDLVRICKDSMLTAGLDVKLDKKATSTEASLYFRAGYEAVIFGPGRSHGNSHSPNEFNYLEHLEKATLFYEKLIERVCL